jgi:short-subunit dehydrogenase
MRLKLKPLTDQVVVITGASSGIGLTTAEMAAERGARVVLSARNEEALRGACDHIRHNGGLATYFAADVADEVAMERLARHALAEFGGFDTWVNNAGISIYGKLDDTPLDDKRRLFDVNFWGVVNGCRVAVPHLREHGGAIINIGSIVSDVALPLQGIYSASKHAVQGYTDALRMELLHEGAPVAVSLVKPAAVDTPYPEHARAYIAEEPTLPPPVYAPEVVARAILACAERPVREITVGGAGRAMSLLKGIAPGLMERYLEKTMFRQQKKDRPARVYDALYSPRTDGRRRGSYEGRVFESSAYTRAKLSRVPQAVGLLALGAALMAGVSAARR